MSRWSVLRRRLTNPVRGIRVFEQRHCFQQTRNATTIAHRAQIIPIPVRGHGKVEIEVLPPLTPPPEGSRQSVLIHLPSGSFPAGQEINTQGISAESNQIAPILSAALPGSIIVTINYRLSAPEYRFPLPIHDTFIAFDHIHQQVLPKFLSNSTSRSSPLICVYGSHIGGSLALSLALTEPKLLHAVAVSSAICNWVDLEDSDVSTIMAFSGSKKRKNSPKRRTKSSTINAALTKNEVESAVRDLRIFRSTLFPKPDTYFDSFASPSLFLRSPGRDCPTEDTLLAMKLASKLEGVDSDLLTSATDLSSAISHRSANQYKVLQRWPPYQLQHEKRSRSNFNHSSSSSSSPSSTSSPLPLTRLLFPGYSSNAAPHSSSPTPPVTTTTPHTASSSISSLSGIDRVLRHQSLEMTDLLQRACFNTSRSASISPEAERRVTKDEVDPSVDESEIAARAAGWLRGCIEDANATAAEELDDLRHLMAKL